MTRLLDRALVMLALVCASVVLLVVWQYSRTPAVETAEELRQASIDTRVLRVALRQSKMLSGLLLVPATLTVSGQSASGRRVELSPAKDSVPYVVMIHDERCEACVELAAAVQAGGLENACSHQIIQLNLQDRVDHADSLPPNHLQLHQFSLSVDGRAAGAALPFDVLPAGWVFGAHGQGAVFWSAGLGDDALTEATRALLYACAIPHEAISR